MQLYNTQEVCKILGREYPEFIYHVGEYNVGNPLRSSSGRGVMLFTDEGVAELKEYFAAVDAMRYRQNKDKIDAENKAKEIRRQRQEAANEAIKKVCAESAERRTKADQDRSNMNAKLATNVERRAVAFGHKQK